MAKRQRTTDRDGWLPAQTTGNNDDLKEAIADDGWQPGEIIDPERDQRDKERDERLERLEQALAGRATGAPRRTADSAKPWWDQLTLDERNLKNTALALMAKEYGVSGSESHLARAVIPELKGKPRTPRKPRKTKTKKRA